MNLFCAGRTLIPYREFELKNGVIGPCIRSPNAILRSVTTDNGPALQCWDYTHLSSEVREADD